jgi:carboxymethylenebutenolidase
MTNGGYGPLCDHASMTNSRTIMVERGEVGAMPLHLWVPPAGAGPGILLLQEIFGVGPYIRAVANRLCDAGYVVGAPEVFWRFAPGWEAAHDEAGLQASLAKVGELDPGLAGGDSVAALDLLGEIAEVVGTPGVMGFCLGGTLAWAVAAGADPSVCVSYYGSGVASMLDAIDDVTCPTLFHFGNDDAYIPAADVDAINTAIGGRTGFVLNVENAGHAFDNHESAMFWNESAAQSAWAKTMAFLGEHLAVG